MDHIGLLGFIRHLQAETAKAFEASQTTRHVWNLSPGVVVMPETLCPWCSLPLRSSGIWLFSGPPRFAYLEGMIPLDQPKIQIVYPNHPQMTSGGGRGGLCLGTYTTGMALLAGPANLRDCPMGIDKLPGWYNTYWDHPLCRKGFDWYRTQSLLYLLPGDAYAKYLEKDETT